MKIRSIHLNDDFGFIAFQEEVPIECWFFHSKAQGRSVLNKIAEDENIVVLQEDVANCMLPEESELESLRIEGRAAETLSRLITPIAQASQGSPAVILEDEKTEPHLYFLLTPRKEDTENPNALLGLRDEEGNHSVFILYSKRQGREVLKSRCNKMQGQRMQLATRALDESYLPEDSKMQQVRIGDPMACYLNNGYVMQRGLRG